jgi:hypothetical protein
MTHVSVFWLIVGIAVGFDATLAYCWLTLRSANRSRDFRWRVTDYTGRTGRKPW